MDGHKVDYMDGYKEDNMDQYSSSYPGWMDGYSSRIIGYWNVQIEGIDGMVGIYEGMLKIYEHYGW